MDLLSCKSITSSTIQRVGGTGDQSKPCRQQWNNKSLNSRVCTSQPSGSCIGTAASQKISFAAVLYRSGIRFQCKSISTPSLHRMFCEQLEEKIPVGILS